MRSATLLLLLTFACKLVPIDLGGDPDDETTGSTSGTITSSSDGLDSTGVTGGSGLDSTGVAGESGLDSTGAASESGISSTGGPFDELVSCRPNHADECSGGAICCSDDPATVGGKTPNYFQPGTVNEKYGTPIFSNDNNELGDYGQCVVGGFATPMVNGCPVPCNPTWPEQRVNMLCGVGSTCCQTLDLDPAKDCVIDPQSQRWRAVNGHDIGTPLTNWGGQHTTNQDPLGTGCDLFASEGGGEPDLEVLADCYAQLSVADQRGYCLAAPACPCREDLCDMKNEDWVPRCP